MFAVIHFPDRDNAVGSDRLGRIAAEFSPLFEVIDDRTVAIDIKGLDLVFPGGVDEIRDGLEAKAAIEGDAVVVTGSNLARVILTAICGGEQRSIRRRKRSGRRRAEEVAENIASEKPEIDGHSTSRGDRIVEGGALRGWRGRPVEFRIKEPGARETYAAAEGHDDITEADLDELPLARLSLPRRYAELFEDWGLTKVGDLTSLPAGDLIARLGSEFEPVIRELSGASARPLKVSPERREFVRKIVFEDPIDDLGCCLAAAESGLDELLGEVIGFGLAVSMIEVSFRDHDRDDRRVVLKLPVPSANLRFIVKLLHYEAERIESSAPVRAMEVRLRTAPPRRVQLSFWHPPFPDAERLELTLGKLRRLLGEQNVGVPSMRDSYDPRAFLIDAAARPSSVDTGVDEIGSGYLVLRFFEPPRPVVFRNSADDPRYLEIDRRWQKIRRIGGPWLSSGEWWNDGSFWRRREMDVEIVCGQVFRVVDDGRGEFFAEGYYD